MDGDDMIAQQIRHSTTHPKYLHSNSTSHKWVFGAVAELVDNSVDAKASQFFVDVEENPINPNDKLFTIRDNGSGMDPPHVHKMVSFGHCEKVDVGDGQAPIGHYGNGFKSGSMRIGRDALVFTCDGTTRTVAMLSQSYLEAIKAVEVLVPMASWNLEGKATSPNSETNIAAITKYSPCQTFEALFERFAVLGTHGTYILVFNLRKLEDSLELDFTTNQTDIRIKGGSLQEQDDTPTKGKRGHQNDTNPPEEYSLRAYLSILYMQPHMQIFIRGHRVYSRRLRNSLWKKEDFLYRPNSTGPNSHVYITYGFNTRNKQHMGCFIYHRNRLIKMYMRVGIQFASDSRGVGVIGVVDASFLTPTHNKQDFVQNNFLKLLTNTLKDRLKDYWTNCGIDVSSGGVGIANWWSLLSKAPNKDLRWRQCDNLNCLKWRKLDKGYAPEPYTEWVCSMHPHNRYSCATPEIKPDYKIAPKRKREEIMENTAKRPHVAPPSSVPTPSIPTPFVPSPAPSTPSARYNPTPSPMDLSAQKFREQIAQRQAGMNNSNRNAIPADIGQQQRLYQQAQQIRERLSQHHQMRVKSEPNGSATATAASMKAEPTQHMHAHANGVVTPAVINLDQHECKGCETMCHKMASLVNALGANVSCDELHSTTFDPQMFVYQIRDAFLHEIDTLKQEVVALRNRNAQLEAGHANAQRVEAANATSAQRVEPASSTPARTSIPETGLPSTRVYHLGVDSSSVESRYNTFLTNYRYIDSKLAKGTPSSPTSSSSFSPASPLPSPSSPLSAPRIIPAPATPPSTTPLPTRATPNLSTPKPSAPAQSSTTTQSTTNQSTNTQSTTTKPASDPALAPDRLFVGRVSMLDLLTKRTNPDPPSSSVPTPSMPSMRTATPTTTSSPTPAPIISSPPSPTAAPSSSAPLYSMPSAPSDTRIRIQKVNVKAEPVENLYQYADQETIHINSSQDSQTVN